ncbi:MAG: 5'-methylthioadenosine/adenosylhomocysteine nucleosidase [Burkholderiales bacterium]|nr:5'-methylthioadenosine/adenosylhomocysteine nucleosidase [Burkholderiales bacterium]
MSEPRLVIGLISALHQEQSGLIEHMNAAQTTTCGMRNYVKGRLWDTDFICVLSRLGKVAAAATAATLIERFNVTHVIFTGVAGGIDSNVKVGDIVVADSLIQHDMNASPLFPRFEVPLSGLSRYPTDKFLTDQLVKAAEEFFQHDFKNQIDTADRSLFKLEAPRVHSGLIASGDEFIHSEKRRTDLKQALPNLLAVEMEGAAVAQVCFEFGVPFSVIRTISDAANENSPTDFVQFIERVAARYAFSTVKRLCGGN